MLEEFLDKHHQHFDSDFVVVKIDTDQMDHGKEVASRIRKDPSGGIPWMVILNSQGEEQVTSDGPNGNIGYPYQPAEIDHFMEMLTKTAKRSTPEQLAAIKDQLTADAKKRQARQGQR